MPPGKRRKNYNPEDVDLACKAIKEEGLSIRVASDRFSVPKSTLLDRVNGGHGDQIGRPTVLTEDEEALLLEHIQLLAVWGFPFSGQDLCHFVKAYLDKKGASTRFKDNLPTHRWVAKFLGRHPEFSLRKANPIKRARAAVSREDVQEFFNHFAKSVEGIPPENLFNFDETNFSDDPGSKKCLFKKGTKYCEKVKSLVYLYYLQYHTCTDTIANPLLVPVWYRTYK